MMTYNRRQPAHISIFIIITHDLGLTYVEYLKLLIKI
jgi:hypothetical protein